MKTKLLQTRFLDLGSAYAEKTGALGMETSVGSKRATVDLCYRTVRYQLVYQPKEGLGNPPSTLYCRVYPDKNCSVWLQLPQLLPLLGRSDYRAVYFPYIESARRMDACFAALTDFLSELLPALENLGSTGEDQLLLQTWIARETPDVEPEEILQEGSDVQKRFLSYLDAVETLHLIRFTHFKPWYLYLSGQREKALQKYRSKTDLCAYELGLCEFLASPESKGVVPISDACFALRDKDRISHGKDDILTMGLCALVLFGGFAAVLCLLMGLLQIIGAWGTACWFGAPWYYGGLLAALPAMFGGIALRRKLIPLLFPRDAAMKLEFDDIINDTPLVRKLSGCIFAITAVAALLLVPMLGGPSVRLYEDRAIIHHSLFDRQAFTYEQVQRIYHIQSRFNDFGDRIDLDSYVIETADGRLTDLYGFASGAQTRKKALPIFQEAGIEVVELDSDRDLPGPVDE